MINECQGPTWSDVLLTPPRSPQVIPHIENPQCAGGHTVLSYFPESACIMLLTHVAKDQTWQAFRGQDTLATDLFIICKSPKCPWLTNDHSLPACVAIQTAYRVL